MCVLKESKLSAKLNNDDDEHPHVYYFDHRNSTKTINALI